MPSASVVRLGAGLATGAARATGTARTTGRGTGGADLGRRDQIAHRAGGISAPATNTTGAASRTTGTARTTGGVPGRGHLGGHDRIVADARATTTSPTGTTRATRLRCGRWGLYLPHHEEGERQHQCGAANFEQASVLKFSPVAV